MINSSRAFPFLVWGRELSVRGARVDLMAGLTGAILVLPQGVAFAAIAGMPPEYGLYCAIVPAIVAALFGSSHHLISGPTTAISLVVYSNISDLAAPFSEQYIGLVLSLTLLAGLFQLGLGVARLGVLINFVSHSVILGFTSGAAILIATSQLGGFFGISLEAGHSFLTTWASFARGVAGSNPYVLAVSLLTLGSALALRAWRPRLPALLLAMVAGSAFSFALGGHEHGVKLVGALPGRLPPFALPPFDLEVVYQLAAGALAVAMLGLAEAASIARSVAVKSRQRIDSNQEFIGQGLSNIVGSFFSGYASSGSFTRTGVNYEAGAKTPLAAVFSAVFVAVILLLVSPLTAWLPMPCMAGVIMVVAANLIDMKQVRTVVRASKAEAGVMAITFLSTLFLKLEVAIFAGVMLSLLLYLKRTSNPHFTVLAPADLPTGRHFLDVSHAQVAECPQLKVLRLDGSIFFGAVNHIEESLHAIIRENPEQCHILIVASGINFIDVSGCEMIFQENSELHAEGRELYLCSVKDEVAAILDRGGCLTRLARSNVFLDKADAVAAIVRHRLDPERCRACRARVFLECAQQPGPAQDSS